LEDDPAGLRRRFLGGFFNELSGVCEGHSRPEKLTQHGVGQIGEQLQGDVAVDFALMLQQQIDEHFCAVHKAGGIQQIEPFFVFVCTEVRRTK
jgi:hypothetical protein